MSFPALRLSAAQSKKFLICNNNITSTFYRFGSRFFDVNEPFREKNPPTDIWADKKDPKYTEVEEVTGHWHYVERLFPILRIPAPPGHDSSMGWKAPPTVAPNLPYFVNRTRSHMVPVYADRVYKERVLVTKLKKIQGDIWQLEYDLKSYLMDKYQKEIESHVNEIACFINVSGDYVEDIREWVYNQGF